MPGSNHFYEPLRTRMPREACTNPRIILGPRARQCPDPYIFQVRRMPGSIDSYQSLRTTVRRKASAASLRSHVPHGRRVVEAGPAIARSMSPSDQDVSTTPAMRRCNSSRSPFMSGSLHFYGSPRTGGPRSLHLLRARRPDRPGPSRGRCQDPYIFTGPSAREGPDPYLFRGPAP